MILIFIYYSRKLGKEPAIVSALCFLAVLADGGGRGSGILLDWLEFS